MHPAFSIIPAVVCLAAAGFLAASIKLDLATGVLHWRSREMAAGLAYTLAGAAGTLISAAPVLSWLAGGPTP
jgi:hypothetical protein